MGFRNLLVRFRNNFVGIRNFCVRFRNSLRGIQKPSRQIQKLFRRIQKLLRWIQKLCLQKLYRWIQNLSSWDSETLFVGFRNNFVGIRNFYRNGADQLNVLPAAPACTAECLSPQQLYREESCSLCQFHSGARVIVS